MAGRTEHLLLSALEPLYPQRAERERVVRLMTLLAMRTPPPDPDGYFPRSGQIRRRFLRSIGHGNAELIEDRFLELYAHLHMHEAPYTPEERRRVDASGGYWCHAGGVSPLVKAGEWIRPATVSADLGAGNAKILYSACVLERVLSNTGAARPRPLMERPWFSNR